MNPKFATINQLAALFSLIISLGLASCGGPATTGQATKASGPDQLESEMSVNLLQANQPQAVIDSYEQNKAALQTRVSARIYYATALCQMAGAAKDTANQLRWVRKGLGEFDALLRDFPNEPRVYAYQAITYSNFPTVLGVNELVTADIVKLNEGLKSGNWKLASGELRQLSISYINLAKIYKNAEYLALAQSQMNQDGLADDSQLKTLLANTAKAIK